MKIGIISITLNRLYYTHHCFKTLKEKAGRDYEHIIIDNGSTDGTYEYLREEGFNVIRNEENKGINYAVNQGLNWLKDKDVAVVIKIDNDCEIITPKILQEVTDLFNFAGEKYAVSPRVTGIDTKIQVSSVEQLGKHKIERVEFLGGIFRAMRMKDWLVAQANSTMEDKSINRYLNSAGFKMGYLPELTVHHFETTKGQEKRYAQYFSKDYKL